MAAFAGALGSLAESYGMARRGLEESNLRKVQMQTEQARLELQRQELEQYKNYDPLIDIKLPRYQDPVTKKWYQPMWAVNRGKLENIEIPGGMTDPNDAARFYISQQPKELQQRLASSFQTMTMNHPEDAQGNLDALQKQGDSLVNEFQKQKAIQDRADLAYSRSLEKQQRGFTEREKLAKEQRDARNAIAAPLIKSIQTAAAAKQIYQEMLSAATHANQVELSGQGNSGSFDMYLLQNHMTLLGLLTGLARGGGAVAGRTQRLIEEHKEARSTPEEIQVMINRVKTGSQLSAEQRKNFVGLAKDVADATRDDVEMMRQVYQVQGPQLQQQQQQEQLDLQQDLFQQNFNQPVEPQYDTDE